MASNPGPAANSNPTAAINKHLYRDYRAELAKLTFSSKPIINELSKKAEANVAEAETIITAIENHLRFTVPKLKLPAFYLLDSIIKNVGGMYVSLLHGRIGKIFVEMWKSVDDDVKGNMERTMRTWRHGFEGGHKNVFPDFVLRKIEEDINRLKAKAKDLTPTLPETKGEDLLDDLTKIQSYGKKHALEQRQQLIQREVIARADRYANVAGQDHAANKRRRMPEQERPIHNQDLLREVSNALVKKQVELYRCPSDVVLFSAINALKKIKASVAETTLSPERVREIRRQLLDLDSTSSADAANPQNNNNNARAQWHAGNGAPGSTRSTTPPHPPPAHVMAGSVRRDSSSQSTAFPSPQGHSASHGGRVGSLITQSPGAAMPTDANQLLQNLMSRPDLMSSLSKVAPGLSTSLGALLVPQNQGSGYKYFSQLEPIPLTQVSITRTRPGLFNILYEGFPKLCSQCGWRVADTEEGKEKMKKHLDWHFRRNLRSQNDRVQRAAPRGWYASRTMWEAAANDDDVVMGNSAQGESNTKDEGANSARNIEELKRKTLAVPSGYNNSPCAICKEPFERRFNEDEEDWQFVNAVEVDGTIYHATCNANQTRSIGLLPSPVDSTSGNQ